MFYDILNIKQFYKICFYYYKNNSLNSRGYFTQNYYLLNKLLRQI